MNCSNCAVTDESWAATYGKTYETKAECEEAKPGVEVEYQRQAAAKNEVVAHKLEISCVQHPVHVWPLGPSENFM